MALSFCIVDDDKGTRRMLQHIIEDSRLGEVIGMAEGGVEGVRLILDQSPDVVLMDLLMPDQDGIETISLLRNHGSEAQYVMVSQIENQDMVGLAYQTGIEFFIRKPINRIELEMILRKVSERWTMNRYLTDIKVMLSKLEGMQDAAALPSTPQKTVRDIVQHILMDMGLVGESGSRDIIRIMEYLLQRQNAAVGFPSLKEIYKATACVGLQGIHQSADIEKETKAMEQRLRRALMTGISHLSSIGLTDYSHPKFEYYAPLYFDFEDIRQKMKEMEQGREGGKVKVNIKKFLQVLYLEVKEQLSQ
ncbi:Chemotaxis protein CheY [compost metagenome]